MPSDFTTTGPGFSADATGRGLADSPEASAYTPGDLADGWEFKIIRSHLGLFARRDCRERILAEEAVAGWVLLEKFDDRVMRLKRLRKLHPEGEVEGFDPYRTSVDDRERARQTRMEGWLSCLAILTIPVIITLIISAFR